MLTILNSHGYQYNRASMQETLNLLHVNNQGTEQPAQPPSLVNAIVIHPQESIVAYTVSNRNAGRTVETPELRS